MTNEEHNISPENDFESIRSHNPTKLLCLDPKIKCTLEKISSLTGSPSHGELNRSGAFWHKMRNPFRGMNLAYYKN